MNRKIQPHVFILRTAAVLLILVMLSTSIMVGRYARYTSGATSKDSARVAKFEVTVSDKASQLASILIQPGEDAQKHFTVENKSEVAVALRFQVSNKYGNLPLEFQYPLSGAVAPGETKDVPLLITWPAANNDVQYMGKVDLIEISVQVEQID